MTTQFKTVVIGAHGQLGQALLESRPQSTDCIALARADLDLRDGPAIAKLIETHRPGLVINAAAYTAVDRAETEVDTAFAVNGRAVGLLSDAARSVNAHFVHVSTDFVFDGVSTRAYGPDDERNPLSVYGSSKAQGEDLAGSAATIVRTSWVYGHEGGNFVDAILRRLRTQDHLRVVDDQIGSPTWVIGLAMTVWALGTRRDAGIWHHADAGVASRYDLAMAIAEEAADLSLLDRQIPIIPVSSAEFPAPARRPQFTVLDCARTRAELGEPAVHWRQNLRLMLKRRVAQDEDRNS